MVLKYVFSLSLEDIASPLIGGDVRRTEGVEYQGSSVSLLFAVTISHREAKPWRSRYLMD